MKVTIFRSHPFALPKIFSRTIHIREFARFHRVSEFSLHRLGSLSMLRRTANNQSLHYTMLVWFEEGNTAEIATVFYLRETIIWQRTTHRITKNPDERYKTTQNRSRNGKMTKIKIQKKEQREANMLEFLSGDNCQATKHVFTCFWPDQGR